MQLQQQAKDILTLEPSPNPSEEVAFDLELLGDPDLNRNLQRKTIKTLSMNPAQPFYETDNVL